MDGEPRRIESDIMYSSVERDDVYKLALLNFVNTEYDIDAVYMTAAKRGFYGETWKLSARDEDFFLKIVYCDEHKDVYEQSFPITQHLNSNGIDFISKIVKTKSGKLSTHFDGATIGVFHWIEGENTESNETKPFEYQMLAKVYKVPYDDIVIPKEDFSNKCSDEFFHLWHKHNDKQTLSLLERNRKKLEHRAKRLNKFSKLCRKDLTDFIITHGDAGGNFLMGNGKNYIVDWDGATLAPPERDAWVMCGFDWARELFNKALQDNGIDYSLRPERLAYYCYWFFFFYLNSFLYAESEVGVIKEYMEEYMEEYIDSWIENSITWADAL